MNVYKISCYSTCQSYFACYLQSVTVISDTPENAKTIVKKWLKKEGKGFIYPENRWELLSLGEAIPNKVVDYLEDSDY